MSKYFNNVEIVLLLIIFVVFTSPCWLMLLTPDSLKTFKSNCQDKNVITLGMTTDEVTHLCGLPMFDKIIIENNETIEQYIYTENYVITFQKNTAVKVLVVISHQTL